MFSNLTEERRKMRAGGGRLKIVKNKHILRGIKRSVLLNMRVLLDEKEGARRWVEVELHE